MKKARKVGYLCGYLQKQADIQSEKMSHINPINLVTSPFGMLAATLTPTRTKAEQAAAEKDSWKNILIPGYAGYNLGKRRGRMVHSQEAAELLSEPYYSLGGGDRTEEELANLLTRRQGLRTPSKDIKASARKLQALLASRAEKIGMTKAEMMSHVMLLGGMGGVMLEGTAQSRTADWSKKNPEKAARIRAIVRKHTGKEFGDYSQE